MTITRPGRRLTHEGAMTALRAAVAKAEELRVGQNIVIVDEGGNLLAFLRMDGAKFLSIETATKKAMSAASHRQPTSRLDPGLELKFGLATGGRLTNLEGGLPIIIDGEVVGGIGVGSGSGAQDIEVGKAALAAIDAETEFG